MEKNVKLGLMLYSLAQLLTFTFVTLLQFVEMPLFLVYLVLMHSGIALFVISKKKLIKSGYDVKPIYQKTYLLLALYLPILVYTLLGYLFKYDPNESVKLIMTIIATVINVGFGVYHTLKLKNILFNHS